MIQRPKVGETEDDLLKQQEEFLRASGHQSVSKRKVPSQSQRADKEETAIKRFEIFGDIVEKNQVVFSENFKRNAEHTKGFPKSFLIDPLLVKKRRGKKSLFALQMEKEKKNIEHDMEVEEPVSSHDDSIAENTSQYSDLNKSVHEENLEKLSKLSEKEILEKQKVLLETLNPNLVEFLKKRKKEGKPTGVEPSNVKIESSDRTELQDEEVKKNLEKYLDSKWINLDFIEKEKLEWIGDIPDKSSLEPDKPYSARFDFKGELQPFTTNIDVRNSLYHHGEEPDRPGYTIQELYQLSRSSVLQQRILALNTLANIIRKTKLGYYDKCFDGQLLHKLVESDLFFLLRFSIDENSLVSASVNCLHNLICNESDEFCLDKLLGVTYSDEQPVIFNEMETSKDEEKELKDHVVIGCDLIKGVLRTDLLIRLSYVLNNFSPTREVIVRLINCLVRISRHSVEAARKIFETTNLLKTVYMHIRSNAPVYEGVKLFRVMVTHSRDLAADIIRSYDLMFLVSLIEIEENWEISKKEFYLLKLETIYLWRSLLLHDLCFEDLSTWSPCLVRLLLFYTQKVDVSVENDFDFELFSALTSLVIVCNKKKIPADSNVFIMMQICLEKWLAQVIQHCQYSFAVSKAIGCIFRYFTSHFKAFGVNVSDLEFIRKINSLLVSFLKSDVFDRMSSSLRNYSHILCFKKVTRDPDNLPSLCCIYEEGDGFLKIVQNRSCLPFFISFVKYLRASCRICQDFKSAAQLFFNCVNIRKYISKVHQRSIDTYNWFMKYETGFLSDFLKLLLVLEDREILSMSFRLLPLLRVDDKRARKVLGAICDKNNWGADLEFLDRLYSVFSESLLRSRDTITVLNYKNDLVPEEWMYKILVLLREKETTKPVTDVLRFICYILSSKSELLERVSYTFRYYYMCSVFLTDSNVFDSEIQNLLEKAFYDVVVNREKVNLNLKYDKKKSFYDLYTELIIQYAGVSYGLPVFAEFVLFPLQNRFSVSFRKLLWFEYLHVLRVISLPFPAANFIDLKAFVEPCETDESLLVAYINSVSNNVILKTRNPFVYQIAVGNVKAFLRSEGQDKKLLTFLKRKVDDVKSEELKNDILSDSFG